MSLCSPPLIETYREGDITVILHILLPVAYVINNEIIGW